MPTLLVLTVLLPLIGALALFLLPGLDYRAARRFALATVLVTLACTLVLVVSFPRGATTPQFAFNDVRGPYGLAWIDLPSGPKGEPGPGIRFALGLDGISLVLFALTALLMITSVFASWESIKERAPA